ncbi:MAG: MFS transporter [Planctomycetota bacterium]|nr:MAG: MFS transporter [Planctomycetota bacterium]
MTEQHSWRESIYERLAGDQDGRVCHGLTDEACRETPGNFTLLLIANALTSIGDRLASAKTTLPWLLAAAGAPHWMHSLLVPIRESGSMLPQMLIGAWARSRAIRKWLWVIGSVLQGLCLVCMSWAAIALPGMWVGLVVIASLAVFALSRGLCSIAHKDVLGKTIPKSRRGRLAGWIGFAAGICALATGALMALVPETQEGVGVFVGLLLVAAVLWALAAMVYARIYEFPGETDGGVNGMRAAFGQLRLLVDDAPFRRFVLARALAMGSGLVAPFYIILAREDLGGAASLLGWFIAMEGLASLLSAPIWGRYADRSSRLVFAGACAVASVMTLTVVVWSWYQPSFGGSQWFYPLAFFVLGIAHEGVRLGRKTYLLDCAEGNTRTAYTAVSNSVIGAALLLAGGLGSLAAIVSVQVAMLFLGLAGLLGAWLSWRLPEVSQAS